jgi:heme exporter protein D
MRMFDFSSWQAVLTTLVGLVCMTLVAVGIRLLVMQRVQQRRERENRQINERLKTLMAAYKTLGGSFTGDLWVDPTHLRALRQSGDADAASAHSERARRMRDAVEAALSDVILLGTAEQVRLAALAANEMVAGRKIETAALVESLRLFVRQALDLDAVPADVLIPKQGPVRTAAGGAGARGGAGAAARGAGMAAGGMLGVGSAHAAGDDDPLKSPDTRAG